MAEFIQALCFCLAVGGGPQVAHRFGDLWYTDELLGSGRHLLRLSTTDHLIDWNRAREDRLQAFAAWYAAETCRGRYKLSVAERSSWPKIRPIYARQFLFSCLKSRDGAVEVRG